MSLTYKDLKLNPDNPRTITKIQYEKLKKSIASFTKMLKIRPVAYDEDGIIWGGNMRFRALSDLIKDGAIKDDPDFYKELKGYTLEEKKEFAIRDNVEFGDWDNDVLANKWDDLSLKEWGIETIGWEGEEEEGPVERLDKKKMIVCPNCGHEFTN